MSVYKTTKSRYYQYDFVKEGHRFHGSTGQETRRKAEAVETAKKEAAALALARLQPGETLQAGPDAPTLDEAAAEWWDFKGKNLGRPEDLDDRETRLANAVQWVGPKKRVTTLTTADINQAIAKRRGKLTKQKRVASNGTVNRDIIDTIRPVIRRACKLLKVAPPPIDWAELRLPEPKPKPRPISDEGMTSIEDVLPAWYHYFAQFEARYGLRLEEMFFHPSAIDVREGTVRLQDRKSGDDHFIPLLDEDLGIVAGLKRRAEDAGLDTIWFRVLKSGKLKALTYGGTGHALRKAMTKSGLRASQNAKGSHDFRRHAAINLVRSTGDLLLAKDLLRHKSIQSTMVYVSWSRQEALRAGLKATKSRNSPGPKVATDANAEKKPTLKGAG